MILRSWIIKRNLGPGDPTADRLTDPEVTIERRHGNNGNESRKRRRAKPVLAVIRNNGKWEAIVTAHEVPSTAARPGHDHKPKYRGSGRVLRSQWRRTRGGGAVRRARCLSATRDVLAPVPHLPAARRGRRRAGRAAHLPARPAPVLRPRERRRRSRSSLVVGGGRRSRRTCWPAGSPARSSN